MKTRLILLLNCFIWTQISLAQDLSERSHLCLTKEKLATYSKSIEPRNLNEINLITWNAQRFTDSKFLTTFADLSKTSDILMIQEAMHSSNLQRFFSNNFPMSFSFFKNSCNESYQAIGVMTAARGLLDFNVPLAFASTDSNVLIPKISGYSQLVINNRVVHLINTEAHRQNFAEYFEKQIDHIARFISNLQGPVIWAGDFNTWNPGRISFLKDRATRIAGLKHIAPPLDKRTLVLDHIYVRGFDSVRVEILKETSSDHFPMRAVLKLN